MSRILIGIDPDVQKSGVAYKNGDSITLNNLSFFDLFDFLEDVLREKGLSEELLVVVESGWLNKGNWRKKSNGSAALNAKIGERTGANHETGKKIVEMLEYLEIPYRTVRPTATKLKAKIFKAITKIEQRTNQENRDAYMLIHHLK